MTINDSTIYVDIFGEIRTILVAESVQVTNSTTGATKTASVKASFSDKDLPTPLVIVNGSEKDMAQFKFGGARGKELINVTVDCYYKTTLGVAQMASQVEDAMLNASWSGMDIVGVNSTDGFLEVNSTNYHIKSITFTFNRE